jgi:hypothetical protein
VENFFLIFRLNSFLLIDWLVQPINDEVHDYLYCDTLKGCKDAVLYGYFDDEPLNR